MTLIRPLILLLLVFAANPVQEADLFFTGVPHPTTTPPPGDPIELELVRGFGDRDEGLVFGQIVSLAVNDTGTLAVIDRFGCQVWIIDTETGSANTVGGCGDGPGEFRRAEAAAFKGDTLFVWDQGRASLVKMGLAGDEIERFRLDFIALGAAGIPAFHVDDSGQILAGLNLLPYTTAQEDRYLILFDRFGGTPIRRELSAPPLARSTPRNMAHGISFCVAPDTGGGEVVFALNHWGPQAVFLRRRDLSFIRTIRIPVDWAVAEEHSLRPGHWGPHSPPPRVICGDRYAIAGYRDQGPGPDGETVVSSAAWLVFDLEADVLTILGGDDAPEAGSMLFMTPGAATGNRFFFFTNGFFDYPVIREYRIVARGGD
jgi:hypothetical protein